MRVREFEKLLRAEGCVHVRSHGDHRVYQLPNGLLFSLPVGGAHIDVKPGLVGLYRRRRKMRRPDHA